MDLSLLPDVEALPDVEELAAMGAAEREAVLAVAERIRRQVETYLAEGVQIAEAARQPALDGHRTVTAWERATFNWSTTTAVRIARNGRALAALPHLRAACRKGQIGVDQLSEIGRLHANPRAVDQLPDSDELLTGLAGAHWYDEFALACRRWETLADPDGAERDHRDAHDARSASIRVVGNEAITRAQSGTTDAVLMREILDRFTDAEFHADTIDARLRLGRDVSAADLERSHRQRAFDALKAIFLTAAAGAPGIIGTEPLINIKLDQHTATELLTRAAGNDIPHPPASEFQDRRCETVDGIPLGRADTLTALLTGRIRGYITDPRGVIIHLGRTRRLFTGNAKDAAILQDLRCLWPGCDIRTGHCHTDHTTAWEHNGPTDPANAGRACPHHNQWKTRGYTTTRRNDGHWDTYRPDGTLIGRHTRTAAA